MTLGVPSFTIDHANIYDLTSTEFGLTSIINGTLNQLLRANDYMVSTNIWCSCICNIP